MSRHDKLDPNGTRDDGVPYNSATASLPGYAGACRQPTSFDEPVLLHADNLHERLFVAMNGMASDSGHAIFHMQRLPNGGGHA